MIDLKEIRQQIGINRKISALPVKTGHPGQLCRERY